MDRSSREKINKKIVALNDTLDQMGLIDMFRAFHPKAAEYTNFSRAQGTFPRVDLMFGHKARHNKFKKADIISSTFSDHKAMKLENKRRRTP